MNASKWWLFTPVHPSACSVASWPFAAALADACNLSTAARRRRLVSVFHDGRNSVQKSIHSVLSTHESGNPADAVNRAMQFSKLVCCSFGQWSIWSTLIGWRVGNRRYEWLRDGGQELLKPDEPDSDGAGLWLEDGSHDGDGGWEDGPGSFNCDIFCSSQCSQGPATIGGSGELREIGCIPKVSTCSTVFLHHHWLVGESGADGYLRAWCSSAVDLTSGLMSAQNRRWFIAVLLAEDMYPWPLLLASDFNVHTVIHVFFQQPGAPHQNLVHTIGFYLLVIVCDHALT